MAKLGVLIRQLSSCKPEAPVYFDFCDLVPDGIESYRGYYDQLAIGWKEAREAPTVADVLAMLRGAVGKTFMGYKGGDFLMDEDTEVWVDNSGRATGTIITHVEDDDWCVYLRTDAR